MGQIAKSDDFGTNPIDVNAVLNKESANLISAPSCDPNEIKKTLSFEELAKKLGIPSSGNGCPYSIDDLTKNTQPALYILRTGLSKEKQALWNCPHLLKHLGTDSLNDCRPDPKLPQSAGAIAKMEISGKIRYFLWIKEPYRYDLERDADGLWTVTIRIAFHGGDASAVSRFERLLKAAEDIWNAGPDGPYKVRFRFLHVDATDNPYYDVELYDDVKDSSRRRFNDGWGLNYTKWSVAHEIGHMLGFNDEYDQASATLSSSKESFIKSAKCSGVQLMCDGNEPTGIPAAVPPYYHYLVLRRAFCRP